MKVLLFVVNTFTMPRRCPWCGYFIQDQAKRRALRDFIKKRQNGKKQDKPDLSVGPPGDGRFTWGKGGKGLHGYVYGVQSSEGGRYQYEVRYDAGPGDKEWFLQADCNYLTRILHAGQLKSQAPDVWYLRELSYARGENVNNIAAWWRTKVFLPNIDLLLERAKREYNYSYGLDREITARLIQSLSLKEEGIEGELINIVRGYMGLCDTPKSSIQRFADQIFGVLRANLNSQGLLSKGFYKTKGGGMVVATREKGKEPGIATTANLLTCNQSGDARVLSGFGRTGMFFTAAATQTQQYDQKYFEAKRAAEREANKAAEKTPRPE